MGPELLGQELTRRRKGGEIRRTKQPYLESDSPSGWRAAGEGIVMKTPESLDCADHQKTPGGKD
jgi:hypothetical protein